MCSYNSRSVNHTHLSLCLSPLNRSLKFQKMLLMRHSMLEQCPLGGRAGKVNSQEDMQLFTWSFRISTHVQQFSREAKEMRPGEYIYHFICQPEGTFTLPLTTHPGCYHCSFLKPYWHDISHNPHWFCSLFVRLFLCFYKTCCCSMHTHSPQKSQLQSDNNTGSRVMWTYPNNHHVCTDCVSTSDSLMNSTVVPLVTNLIGSGGLFLIWNRS